MLTIDFTTYNDDGDPQEMSIPAVYEVCGYCRGSGTSSAYLGAFTSDDEWMQDDDFRDNYFSGAYDQTCPQCQGLRVVLVPDDDTAPKDALKAYYDELNAEAQYAAEVAAERRAGC